MEKSAAAMMRTRLIRAIEALMPSTKRVKCASKIGIQTYSSRYMESLAIVGKVERIRPMLAKAISATKMPAAFVDFLAVK